MLSMGTNGADLERVGAQVKAERSRRDWTQRELGKRIGMHRSRVSKIEKGRVRPGAVRVSEMLALNEALGIPLDAWGAASEEKGRR